MIMLIICTQLSTVCQRFTLHQQLHVFVSTGVSMLLLQLCAQ